MTDDTNAQILAQAGQALFGSDWRSATARLLDVSLRRIQYYASNERQPPDAMLLEIAGHLERRVMDAGALAAHIRSRPPQVLKRGN